SEKKDLADSYLDEIVCLKNANKVARDMLQRFNMPTHTIPMLSKKPKAATADLHKDLLGTRNPGLGYMAKRAQPVLYDADTLLHPTHHPVSIWDSEDLRSACDREHTKVLELEAEVLKQQKMVIESEKRNSHLQKTHIDLQLKFQNYKQCIDTSSASNAIFEINKLRKQLQGKDDTIRNLDAQINIMKVLNVGSTKGSCDQQALETDRIQLKDTITSLRIQLDGLKVENVSLKRRYDELSKANTHSRTAYTEKLSALTTQHTKLQAQVTGKTSSGPSTSETPKVLAPGMYNLGSKYIPPPKRANWDKPTPLPKKKQVTFVAPPRPSLKPTQKPVVHRNKQPNVCVPMSTGVKPTFRANKPVPKRDPRNRSSLPAKRVHARRVKAHHRTLNKKNRVDSHLLVKLDLENKVRQEQALVIQRNMHNAELVQENDLLKSTLSGKEKSIAFLQSEKEKILSEKKDLADSYLDEIVCLKNANKVERDMLQRCNMPTHTIPMLSKKPKAATADLHKDLLGTRNPGLGYMAKRAQPVLYDADTLLHPTHHPVSIWDSEEVLVHQVVSMKKMNEKPGHVRPANGFYEKLNALMFVPQQELSREQAYWLPANERASQTSNPNSPVTPFIHKSRPPSQVLASLQKVNAVFPQFEGIIKERTTQKPDYVSEWCFDYAKQFVEQQLVPFYDHFKKHIQAANDTFFKEIREFEQIFDDLEAEYEQCVLDNKNLTIEKKNLLIKNDCLIAECLEKDICSIVLTSDIVVPPSSNCLCEDLRSACDREHTKVLELEAEISKQKQLITESEKRFAFLEQNYVCLQLKFQNYKQCIDTSSASNAIFEINKLRQQLQGKDDTIRNLETQINITRMLNVGSTEGSCDQQALETDRIQLQDMITSLRIQLDGLKVENVSLKRRYDELSKGESHSRTALH
ncbi:hypothetical protein Tco_1482764, partial [Tanacetum coccineum]